jgi:isopenicillin N synthase-like dioxygenase
MTWTKIIGSQAPFPDDVPTYDLPKVSYRRLLAGDVAESDKVFQACKDTGFFLLDLAGPQQGERFLKDAEEILMLAEEFSELDDAEKSEYRLQQPHHIFGSVGAVGSDTIFFSNSFLRYLYSEKLTYLLEQLERHRNHKA